MQHYMQIQTTLGDRSNELVKMSEFLERNTKAIDADCIRLFGDGWKGAAADSFGEIRVKLSNLEKATTQSLLSCAAILAPLPGNGTSAVQAGQHQILQTFGGSGFAYSSSHDFGFNDGEDEVPSIVSNIQDQIENLTTRLAFVRGKAAAMNEDKGTVAAINAAATAADSVREEVQDFSSRLNSAKGTYNDFLDEIKTAFSSGKDTMKGLLKNKDLMLQPPAGEVDMSSPLWRAYHMARLSMQIPPEYRDKFEALCYNAPEPYRTIFFGYLDTIDINGWDGPLGIRNWSIKDMLPGGITGSSMSTPEWGIWMNIDYNNPNAPGMDIIKYGEPPNEISAPSFFSVLFHEIGHRIDYNTNLAGTLDTSSDTPHWMLLGATFLCPPPLKPLLLSITAADLLLPTMDSNTELNRLISADVRTKLGEYATNLINSDSFAFPELESASIVKSGIVKQAIDNIMAGKEVSSTHTGVNMLQRTLQQDFTTVLKGGQLDKNVPQKYSSRDFAAVSDVYGGSTGALVRGNYSHDAGYWNGFENYTSQTRAGKMTGLLPVISPQIELIAQSFSDGMLNNKTAQAATKEYLPTANTYLDDLYKSMEKMAAARMAGKK